MYRDFQAYEGKRVGRREIYNELINDRPLPLAFGGCLESSTFKVGIWVWINVSDVRLPIRGQRPLNHSATQVTANHYDCALVIYLSSQLPDERTKKFIIRIVAKILKQLCMLLIWILGLVLILARTVFLVYQLSYKIKSKIRRRIKASQSVFQPDLLINNVIGIRNMLFNFTPWRQFNLLTTMLSNIYFRYRKNKNHQLTSFVILHFNNKFQVYVIMRWTCVL